MIWRLVLAAALLGLLSLGGSAQTILPFSGAGGVSGFLLLEGSVTDCLLLENGVDCLGVN